MQGQLVVILQIKLVGGDEVQPLVNKPATKKPEGIPQTQRVVLVGKRAVRSFQLVQQIVGPCGRTCGRDRIPDIRRWRVSTCRSLNRRSLA